MLDLDIDPKLAWALRHLEFFPVDINKASREVLMRIPGLGAITANKIIKARKFRRLRYGDLGKCGLSVKKAGPFIQTLDHNPDGKLLDSTNLKQHFLKPSSPQLALF